MKTSPSSSTMTTRSLVDLSLFVSFMFSSSSSSASSFLFVGADSSSPSEYFGGRQEDNQGYLDWALQSPVADWTSRTYLASSADPSAGAAVHWRIDNATSTIHLGVATKSTGWIALGLSTAGGMLGSDMFVVEASNLTAIKDLHVLDTRFPVEDECQNWILRNATLTDDGFFLVMVERALDTSDPQDLVVHDDSQYAYPVSHVVAAWGNDDTLTYHGWNRAHSGIRWHSDGSSEHDLFVAHMDAQNARSVRIGANNHTVQLDDTEYAYFCARPSDLAASGVDMTTGNPVTVIGFEPVIDNAPHVHHFILLASTEDLNDTAVCDRGSVNSADILYLWGPGEPPFIFPDNVGMSLGGALNGTGSAYRTFLLQVHYDNANVTPNQVDSSGVKAYYTTTPRQYEAGVFSVGDPNIFLREQPIESGLASYTFACPSSCSSIMLADEPVTVIREYLHMHQSGYAMYNEHVRDGQVIRTGGVDFFEFAMSGGPALQQQPYEILPGDSFNVHCYYQNAPDANRTFGLSSSQEMCISFLLYYPRKILLVTPEFSIGWLCSVGFADYGFPQCDAPVSNQSLREGTVPDHRAFGIAPDQCLAKASATPNGSSTTTSQGTSGGAVAAPSLLARLLFFSMLAMVAILKLP